MAISTLPAKRTKRVKRTGKTGSSIFLKVVMAVTGVIFVLYVLAHMYGNLKLFAGHAAYNEYAEGLRTLGTPELPRHGFLTIMEIVLVVAVLLHIYSAVVLWRRSSAARPQRYAVKKTVVQSFSSKWMRWGGLALLLFIIWHLIEFSLFRINVGSGGQSAQITQDPFELVVHTFNTWWMTLIYLVAMAALLMHLHHGVWSASQTLGLAGTPAARRYWKLAGLAIGVIVAVGFIIPPLFILFGVIK